MGARIAAWLFCTLILLIAGCGGSESDSSAKVAGASTRVRPLAASATVAVPAVKAGYVHSLALKNDGTVWAWGSGGNGALGNNTSDAAASGVVQVVGPGGNAVLDGVTAIAAGYNLFSLALRNDGTVWAWGFGGDGALGNNSTANSSVPIQVVGPDGTGALNNVTAIAAGLQHSLALKSDGTVWAWGYGGTSALGNNGTANNSVPVQVVGPSGTGALTGVTAIAAGDHNSLALRNDGTAWAWGYGALGGLGNNSRADSSIPVQVWGPGGAGKMTGVAAIAAANHSLALRNDGTLWAWGFNSAGQLGNNSAANDSTVPVQIVGPNGIGVLTDVMAISASYHNSLALKSDGTVLAWGENTWGQLGNNTFANSSVPAPVLVAGGSGAFADVIAISGGRSHALAAKSDGTVWAWGNGLQGQLGSVVNSPLPVQVVGPGGVGFLNLGVGAPTPTIATINPATGSAGTPVTISGTGFGAVQGSSVVRFGSTPAIASTWSSTQIGAVAPNGLAGPVSVVVTTAAGPSNGVTFTYAPTLPDPPGSCSLAASPASLAAGGGQVTLVATCTTGGAPTSYSWSGGFAEGLATTSSIAQGTVSLDTTFSVVASNAGGTSPTATASVSVAVAPPSPPPPAAPVIASLTPAAGPAGTAVTLTGQHFGQVQSTSLVLFGTTPAAIVHSWSDTRIVAAAPANGDTAGEIPILVQVGVLASNPMTYTYTAPTKIENKCEPSLLGAADFLLFYKKTCEFIDVLRAEFLVSSQDATTDELFRWLRTADNEVHLRAWVANRAYGHDVAAYYDVGGPVPKKATKLFLGALKDGAEVLAGFIEPIIELIEKTPVQVMVVEVAQAASTIVTGLEALDLGKRTIAEPYAREVFREYVLLRNQGSLEAARERITLNQSDSIEIVICRLNVAYAKCSDFASSPEQFNAYLSWLETLYQARRLAMASEEERDAVGNAIAAIASGRR